MRKPRKRTPTYLTWRGMILRCYNPKTHSYELYGGRGITVCRRWRTYINFLEDMGPRPAVNELDRIDSNGNYKPTNCRWATKKENAQNRRNNRFVLYGERRIVIAEAERLMGMKRGRIRARMRKVGYPEIDVLAFQWGYKFKKRLGGVLHEKP